MELNYKQLNRKAIKEAINNDILFTWYQREGELKHGSAIVLAIASRTPFSYIK